MALNSTEELIADIRAGKMVILMDDEDRENEGDLCMAAEHVTPEAINFMARYGRGLICLTIDQARNDQLKLWYQAGRNNSPFHTNFTVSIEAAQGVTTGISAADRAHTIQTAVASAAKPEDLVQPGHIFPIVARDGGVLVRAGHTEASTDLARLAGLKPAGCIVEILKEDGSMARRPELEAFAREHNLKIGTIADLIAYRLQREQTVERLSSCELPTEFGSFTLTAYQSIFDRQRLHYALSKGPIQPGTPTFVRVHVQNTLADLFHANLSERNFSLATALKRLASEEHGVLVVIDDGQSAPDVLSRIDAFAHGRQPPKRSQEQNLRSYGLGAQILIDQGVRRMRLLSAPYKFTGISGYQLEVAEFLPSEEQD